MGFASFLGWLAAFGISVVVACRFVSRRRAASGADDQSLDAQRKAALRRDLAYLTKQAANVRHLRQTAEDTGNQLDRHLDILERREFVDDAARFIVAARAEGSKEFLNGAGSVETLLRELRVADED